MAKAGLYIEVLLSKGYNRIQEQDSIIKGWSLCWNLRM